MHKHIPKRATHNSLTTHNLLWVVQAVLCFLLPWEGLRHSMPLMTKKSLGSRMPAAQEIVTREGVTGLNTLVAHKGVGGCFCSRRGRAHATAPPAFFFIRKIQCF